MSSIKRSFLYSAILTVSGFLFSFITFPHVSRVLGVSNFGIYNFIDGVISYAMLFSMLGISSVGIREIAKNRNDTEALEESFKDIFFLNGLFTLLVVVLLSMLIFIIPKFYLYKELMIIGIAKLVFNFLLVEWFFKGIENFRYITIRSLIVKTIYVVSVFVFVKKSDDYILFAALTTGMFGANAFFNWRFLTQLIRINYRSIDYKRYLPNITTLGMYMILTSMYTSFNVIYLGFIAGETEVGYYTTATKLYSVLLALFTAFTGVMLPRMSALITEGKMDEFRIMTQKSYDVLFGFSFPVVVFSVVFAPQIIHLIAGEGYEGAILPMRIVMPLMLIIGYEQILILQILMPLRKDKAILINSLIGASLGIILNIALVPTMKAQGAGIAWVFSEIVVLLSAQYFVKKYTNTSFPVKKIVEHTLIAVPATAMCLLFYFNPLENFFINMVVVCLAITIYYCFVHIKILKNSLFVDLLKRLLMKKTLL